MKNIISFLYSFLTALIVLSVAGLSPLVSSLLAFGIAWKLPALLSSMGINHAFTLISGTPIDFNGKEATEGILIPAYEDPTLSMFMTFIPGIVARQQVAYLPQLNKITKLDPGCGLGVTPKSVTPTQKFWNPVPLKIWIQQCASDVETTLFTWGLNKGIARKDLTGTDYEDYVLEVVPTAISEDNARMFWLSDVDADTNANGGHLLNASDVDYYNQFDGIWKRIFTGVTGGTIRHVTISENTQLSFATQLALASNKAYTTFKSMLTGATDPRLKNSKGKMIICTTSLMENWLDYKESQSFDRSFERQDKGFQTDVYRGITIIAYDLWDRFLQADFQDGTAYYLPHRAILTTKANLQYGLDTESVDDIKVFYDEMTETNNIKGAYKADTMIAFDFLVVAAY